MAVMSPHFARAISLAHRSSIKTFQTGAVLVNSQVGGTSSGWSHYSERRLSQYRSVHAELHALLRADPKLAMGGVIYIATVRRKSGNIGLARPCEMCLDLLSEVGIKEAWFTVEGVEYDHMRI